MADESATNDAAVRAEDDQDPNEDPNNPAPDDQQAETESESDESETPESETVDYWKRQADEWKREARKAQRINRGEAGKLNEEITQLREQVANHDAADTEMAGTLATERLHTKLARAGVSENDAAAMVDHMDPMKLLSDGQPSTEAIDSVAESLARTLGRTTAPDGDQGQRGTEQPFSADQWLRNKARSK